MIQYYHSTSAEHASSQLKGIVYLNPRVSIIHKSHIEIIPTIVISASKHGIERGDSRTRRVMQNLSAHNNQTNKKLDRYSHMRINDIDKFDYIYEGDMERITKDVQLEGIVSLDLSLPYPSSEKICAMVSPTPSAVVSQTPSRESCQIYWKLIYQIIHSLITQHFVNFLRIAISWKKLPVTILKRISNSVWTARKSVFLITLRKSIWTIPFSVTPTPKKQIFQT